MFEPPPGYEDMLGDAETAPWSDRYDVLDVEGIGAVRARRPMPGAVATLAMAGNNELDSVSRSDYLVRFVVDHLSPDDVERVFLGMASGGCPIDSMERLSRAIATWGTSRPYIAVITLAVLTAHHWRTLRLKLVTSGIYAPMALPTMHMILDTTESSILEALTVEGGKEGEMKRRLFLDKLYAPIIDPTVDAAAVIPDGFSADEVEDSFDAFAAAAG